MTKPLSSEQGRLVKRIRTGKTGPLTFRGTEEPEGMIDAPLERSLKEIIKKETVAPVIIQPGPSGIKKTPKPSTSGTKKGQKLPNPPFHLNHPRVKAPKGDLISIHQSDTEKNRDRSQVSRQLRCGRPKRVLAQRQMQRKASQGQED